MRRMGGGKFGGEEREEELVVSEWEKEGEVMVGVGDSKDKSVGDRHGIGPDGGLNKGLDGLKA